MNENPSNPYAGEDAQRDAPARGTASHDNPYMRARQGEPVPDLDAAAPSLRSAESQRVNRKALVFLLGIVGLLGLMTFLAFRGDASEDARAKPKEQQVVIPDLPESPESNTAQADPVPMAMASTPSANELPPMPSDAVPMAPAPAPLPGNYGAMGSTVPVAREPSLRERRMGVIASDAPAGLTPEQAYAQAMMAGARPQPDPEAAAAANAQPTKQDESSTSRAQYLQHPDALLLRGTYLRCILETRIVTDVPGFTSCVVTEPVYSFNGRNVLLPRGTKISGRYKGANGPRVSVAWDRVVTPNGIDVTMSSPGVDNLGGAGHPGDYDAHWGSRITSAVLISLISDAFKYAAAEAGPPTTTVTYGAVVQTPYESNTARSVQRLAEEAIDRGAQRAPTVTINQGTMINIYVAQDVDFSSVLGAR